jgi:hypothetical protein
VAKTYAKAVRTNGASDRIAIQAALKHFQQRYPDMSPDEARRRVSDLIVEAVGKGLVWSEPARE